MTRMNLGCIVEGEGDWEAVPVLVRRIQQLLLPSIDLCIARPVRIGRQKIVKEGELERQVDLLTRRLEPPRAILVLLDADDDLACRLGPELLVRAAKARSDVPIRVVLAIHEFENWFLAGIEGLSGRREFGSDLQAVPNPESIRGAKEALTRLFRGGLVYSPTANQAAFTAGFDMDLARERSPSFNKCWREIERILAEGTGIA